jgi:DNA-binding NarL/FixJ family response regulator
MTISVLVVDDHPMVRDGLRFLAESRDEIEIVGEAATVAEAVAAARQLRPDVVVMDIELDGGSGLDAAARIKGEGVASRVLFLTMHHDAGTVLAALRAGGSGFVVKGAHQNDIVRAIVSAAAGELILGPDAAEILAHHVHDLDPGSSAFPDLTAREREVLELMAAGRANGQIAGTLVISRKTVANHVANIITKVGATDRGHAIVLAREAGFGRG